MPVEDAATEDDDATGYRPVSPLAVAAAGMGVASILALVGPAFWMLPLLGTALAWAALADVARPGAPKAGRLAALAGLGLALGFGAQAVATTAAAEWIARSRAEAATRFWLDAIVTDRLDDARSMCGPEAADAVDRVAPVLAGAPLRVRFRGRDEVTGGRLVRAAVGDRGFDVVLEVIPPRVGSATERFTIARCDAVTPSAN